MFCWVVAASVGSKLGFFINDFTTGAVPTQFGEGVVSEPRGGKFHGFVFQFYFAFYKGNMGFVVVEQSTSSHYRTAGVDNFNTANSAQGFIGGVVFGFIAIDGGAALFKLNVAF